MQHWRVGQIDRAMMDKALAALPESDTLAAIGIVNRTILWLRPSNNVARSVLMDAILRDLMELTERFHVPDVPFMLLNCFDEPLEPLRHRHRHPSPPLPVFSFFQTRAAADVLMPDGYFRGQDFDRTSLLGPRTYRKRHPWTKKREVALWRGSLYCGPNRFLRCSRLHIAHLSDQRAHPMLDVQFTTYKAIDDEYAKMSPEEAGWAGLPNASRPLTVAPPLPMANHSDAKYLVQLDGYTAAGDQLSYPQAGLLLLGLFPLGLQATRALPPFLGELAERHSQGAQSPGGGSWERRSRGRRSGGRAAADRQTRKRACPPPLHQACPLTLLALPPAPVCAKVRYLRLRRRSPASCGQTRRLHSPERQGDEAAQSWRGVRTPRSHRRDCHRGAVRAAGGHAARSARTSSDCAHSSSEPVQAGRSDAKGR
jgi:hypothetical protein